MEYRNHTLYLIAGILMGISLIYPVWLLGFLGIGISIYALEHSQTWRERYLGLFLAFTIKSLFATNFFWAIYPIEWLPFEIGSAVLFIIGLCWFGVGVSLGTGGLWLVGLLHLLSKTVSSSRLFLAVVLPFAWMIAEVLGSLLFSIFSIGPGGTFNAYFSFGYVGYLIAQHPLLLLSAHIAGVYGMTVVMVGLVVGFLYLLRQRRRYIAIALFVLLVGTTFVSLPEKPHQETVTTTVITTNFPVTELFNREGLTQLKVQQSEAFKAALTNESDYILWPEDARFFDQTTDIRLNHSMISFLYPSSSAIVIDSSRVPYGDSAILQGLILDTNTNQHEVIHKRYLVPQGEFVPSLYELILRALGFDSLIDELESMVSYRIGPQTNQSSLSSRYPGILFCFEGISPTGVRQIVQEHPEAPFIAHPISHGWFHEPKEVWHQLDAALKVQAVWNDISIVSPASHAKSKIYLPDGQILTPTPNQSGEFWEVAQVTIPVR